MHSSSKPQSDSPIKVTIIAGFLGAGKTSLLSSVIRNNHDKKLAVLVNDFGVLNIDAQLIVNVDGETVSLSNGCICCTIREDLLQEVITLATKPLEQRPDHVVIETSGVSDPNLVAHTFSLAATEGIVDLDGIVSVVDAAQILALEGQDQDLITKQIKCADIVVFNKIDLVEPAALKKVEQLVSRIAPRSRTIHTTHGEIPTGIVLDIESDQLTKLPEFTPAHSEANLLTNRSNHSLLEFESWLYSSERSFSLLQVREIIERMPSEIYRMKGFLRINTGDSERAQLQMTGGRAWLKLGLKWEHLKPSTDLVFIGRRGAFTDDTLTTFVEQFLPKDVANTAEMQSTYTTNNLRALSILYAPRHQRAEP